MRRRDRARRRRAAPFFWATVVGAFAAGCGDEPPSAPAPAPVVAPVQAGAVGLPAIAVPADFAARHSERLAALGRDLEASSAAAAAYGHESDFAAALRASIAAAGDNRWIRVADGALPRRTLESWLRWSLPPTEGAKPQAIDLALANHPFAAIADLARQLAARSIEFLFVALPCRVVLEPELLDPTLHPDAATGAPFNAFAASQRRFLLELVRAGVEVVDLSQPFCEQRIDAKDARRRGLYLTANTHWTPRAAELAARVVAERLARQPWFAPGPFHEGNDFRVERLLTMLRGEGVGQAPQAPSEAVAADALVPADKSRPLPQSDEKLARQSPIVLLGDSFCWFYKDVPASFTDQLFRFTGWPIDVIAPAGNAEFAGREALRRRNDGLAGKRVVIWLMQDAVLEPSELFRKVDLAGQ